MTKPPKLTVNRPETPSEQLVKEATQEHVVIDRKGRKIRLAKPSVLSQFRIVKVLGPDAAANQTYVGMIMPLLFVASIEDDPVYFPNTEAEIDALIQRLSDEGIEAVALGVQEHWGGGDPNDPAAAAKKAEADKTAIKK